MWGTMIGLLKKYKYLILYGVFGVLSTIINMFFYYICYNLRKISNVHSTIIAWTIAVIFAFITNKLWVFGSRSIDASTLKHEITSFFGARIATGIFDVIIMFVAVNIMEWNSSIWKFISNVFVIIINYVASRLVVFIK